VKIGEIPDDFPGFRNVFNEILVRLMDFTEFAFDQAAIPKLS